MNVDITKELRKYVPIFQHAQEHGLNEAETSMRISKFFEDVLGYDIFSEVTKEYTVKDRYVDYAIKLNGKTILFVETKQAGLKLKEAHIEQASNYAANAGISWVILTNGGTWQMYHLTFDEGIQSELIWSTDILEDDFTEAASKLSMLHKKSILKNEHEAYYTRVRTLSPKTVIQAIFHETTLKVIRAHLRQMTGIKVDEDELATSIKKMLSAETWEGIGDIKIKRKRKSFKTKQATSLPPVPPVGSSENIISPSESTGNI